MSLRRYFLAAAGAWDHTAGVMAAVRSALGGRAVHPNAINPFRRPGKAAPPAESFDEAWDEE